ncbi:N-6 DNA methylase [Gemmiger sp.]
MVSPQIWARGAADALTEDLHAGRSFDYIIMNPPFNFSEWCENGIDYGDVRWQYGIPPRKNANFAWLQYVIAHLRPDGRAVVLLPNGTLTTRNRAERMIRARILGAGWVEAILALPAGLFQNTRVPCCAWFLRRDSRRDTVLFVDARQMHINEAAESQKLATLFRRYRAGKLQDATEWYAAALMAEIEENNYLLSPNLYTRQKPLAVPMLGKLETDFNRAADALCAQLTDLALCEHIQRWKTTEPPQAWRKWRLPDVYEIAGGVVAEKNAFGHGTPMADVKTAIQHMFLPKALPARVELPERERQKYDLRAGDILLNRTSETVEQLACGCAVLADCEAVYGAYLKRLRPKESIKIDPRYAAGYFRSRAYRREVRRVCPVYTTRANINLHLLAEICIYAPDAPWQAAIGETLERAVRFGQAHPDVEAAVQRFTEAFVEKYITYPIARYQKECDRG